MNTMGYAFYGPGPMMPQMMPNMNYSFFPNQMMPNQNGGCSANNNSSNNNHNDMNSIVNRITALENKVSELEKKIGSNTQNGFLEYQSSLHMM